MLDCRPSTVSADSLETVVVAQDLSTLQVGLVRLISITHSVSADLLLFFLALAALGTQQQSRPQANQQTHEMTVPNELIGCIIGKGGSKIAEIR